MTIDSNHIDELLSLNTLIVEQNNKMLDLVQQGILSTLKGIFILNGTAAVSMLALFTKALIEKEELQYGLLDSTFYMAIGILAAIVASIFMSLGKHCYMQAHSYHSKKLCCEININRLEEMNEYSNINKVKLNEEFMTNKIEHFTKEKIKYDSEFAKIKRFGDYSSFLMVLFVILSCSLFVCGIYKTRESFKIAGDIYRASNKCDEMILEAKEANKNCTELQNELNNLKNKGKAKPLFH